MIRREGKRLVLTFHTTADAIAMERLCKEQNIPGRLIPVPRELTSDCGMAWSLPPEAEQQLDAALTAHPIEIASRSVLEL